MRPLLAIFRLPALLIAGLLRGLWDYKWRLGIAAVAALLVVGVFASLQGIPVISVQQGFRGVGLVQQYNPREARREAGHDALQATLPPVAPSGIPSARAYRNIQVLQNVDSAEFLRLMASFPIWINASTGCAFCHSAVNMASDALYTKTVARHMIEMTRYINANWKSHVGAAGVTCSTCHRGKPVPAAIWFSAMPEARGAAESGTGFSGPSRAAALTSLPSDPFTPFLLGAYQIRVTGPTALPSDNRVSIKRTDETYALMAHFAASLGVNCTFCHNSRDFSSWDQGTPNRVTAWHGIEMVRDINTRFMLPLTGTFPRASLGPSGDVPKINCGTCHQGAYKPFYGASNLSAFPELAGPATARQASAAAPSGAIP